MIYTKYDEYTQFTYNLNNTFNKRNKCVNRQGEPVLVFKKPRWVPEEPNPKVTGNEPDLKRRKLADPASCGGNLKV